jgi:ABC-type Fe3+-siderophore transport system permease subunit
LYLWGRLSGGMLMKKGIVIGMIFVFTIVLLFVTKSAYVEWTEVYIIIGSLSAISIVYNLFSKERRTYTQILGGSALIGFFFSIAFSLMDLVSDHYKVIKGVPDGRFLTLDETVSEFSDDLVIVVLIVMCSVTLISFVGTTIYSKFFRRVD